MKFFSSFFLFLFLVSFVSSYDLVQQNTVCQTLNLSFIDCYALWTAVDDYPTEHAFYETYKNFNFSQNNTVYVFVNSSNSSNSTVFIDKNCSSELEFVKQADNTRIRLAEIEKNVGSLPNPSLIDISVCESQKAEQFQKGKSVSCDVSSAPIKQDSNGIPTYYWIIAAIVLVGGYFYFNRPMSSIPSPPRRPFYPPSSNDLTGGSKDEFAS